RGICCGQRVLVSGASTCSSTRLGQGRMEDVAERTARALLPADACRPETARCRHIEVGAVRRGHAARACRGGMKIMREIWARIRYLFRQESQARELGEELDAHLQMEIDANLERGMSPEQARDAARREFGSPARLQESSHDAWAFRWLDSILQDFRYSLRQIRKAPGLSLAVVAPPAARAAART